MGIIFLLRLPKCIKLTIMAALDSDYPPRKKRKLYCFKGDQISLSSLPPDIISILLTLLNGSASLIRGLFLASKEWHEKLQNYLLDFSCSLRLQNECFIEDASFLASLSSLRRLSLCDIENTRNLHIISVLTNLRSLCLSGYFYTHILSPFTTTTPTTSRTKYS
jgi:hypothetical protein